MKLTLTLHSNIGTKTLQWRIGDSNLAKRWANLIKSTPRKNDDYHSEFDWWMAYYTQEHLDKIVKKMAVICNKLNAEKGFNIPSDWFLNINRESLNNLHLKFHELAETIPNDSDINQLNYIVHNAESCLTNIQHKQKFSNLIMNLNVFAQEALTHEDFLNCNSYSVPPGSLLLGYDTIGKSLYHCYQDNDIALIAAGMVRPKLTLTSAINCFIHGSSTTVEPAKYYKWCDDNSILERYNYDCRDPLHTGGHCIIGTPVTWNADELVDWLLDSDSVKVLHWAIED